ncbi:CBS domain,Tetratricopeptide repeat,Tetratricopeptide repeat-containing [Cinara cedri]|uniref:CBS domain,Tetratricopeptide repeat,Tetratricopeptide repeat-containing n=1 Tax=Cinara cedri TaxID=506608 RepID=A0A5E4N2N5_9HEMI|nr:CBS domain,Tetratricopeptide repeat,Tetratricopeptide repeat-containing [Cinara cedri]
MQVIQNTDKNFSISSTLKKAQRSFESGDKKAAILFLNSIITKFPYHKNSLIGLGNVYYVNKDYKQAIEIYTKLLKEYPGDSLVLKNFLIVVAKYNPDLALDEMLKLYNTHRNYAPLLANLSLIYIKKGDLIKAKEYMTKAVSIDKNNVFYIYNLAIILDKLLDLENAVACYEKLLDKAMNSCSTCKEIPLHQKISVLKRSATEALMKDLPDLNMFNSLLKFHDCVIIDIMTPRMKICAVDIDSNKQAIIEKVKNTNHTKIPVYKNNVDYIVGFFYVKDIIFNVDKDFNLKHIMQSVIFVPPSMKTTNLFTKMKSSKSYLAIVLDEYGGTDGLISMTDLIEEMIPNFDNENEYQQ